MMNKVGYDREDDKPRQKVLEGESRSRLVV